MRLKEGLVHVYTGNGKGKTTCAFGLAMRAKGYGLDVCVVQFMKAKPDNSAKSASSIGIDVYQFGLDGFTSKGNLRKGDMTKAKDGLDFVKESIDEKRYDLIVLDEINVALDFGLLNVNDVLHVVIGRPKGLEMVLTGRNAPQDILDIADYVTEMCEKKHPFKTAGKHAREGIEY